MYFIAAAAILIAFLAFMIFRSEPTVQDHLSSPAPQQIEQSVPQPAVPPQPANLPAEEHKRAKTETGKIKSDEKNPPPMQKEIDLDQDLKGKPKVFLNPKARMPIK